MEPSLGKVSAHRGSTSDFNPKNLNDLEPPVRKVFNCIVDETALIAGLKRTTRDGIAKWIANGSIRLYVPLYTLERLDRLKKGNGRINADARDVIRWLDEATSCIEDESAGIVQLQGGYETYESWSDVEKFLLPDTLLSMEAGQDDVNAVSRNLHHRLHVRDNSDLPSLSSSCSIEVPSKTPSSPRSTSSSIAPGLVSGSPRQKGEGVRSAENLQRGVSSGDGFSQGMTLPRSLTSSIVPVPMRPLFNHILWLIHQEPKASLQAENTFVLLTNDPKKHFLAQKFGVRVKRLEQLRDAVVREDRDYHNRLQLFRKETEAEKAEKAEEDADEDEILLKRPFRTARSSPPRQILDPNEFGRAPQQSRGRGRAGMPNSPRQLGNMMPNKQSRSSLDRPIDPNSFARPSPDFRRGRGGRRRLWEPT